MPQPLEQQRRSNPLTPRIGRGPALGVCIAGVEVGGDSGLQRGSRAVGAALDLLVGEQCEEALDLVDPYEDVGMKCICQRSRLANQSRISLVLWLDALSMTM